MSTRSQFLPGLTAEGREPQVRMDSRRVIRRARRIALARDLAQLTAVAAVDVFFAAVPSTHVPFADRPRSLALLAAFNFAVVVHAVLCRKFPQWSARRTAATWCAAERRRFHSQ